MQFRAPSLTFKFATSVIVSLMVIIGICVFSIVQMNAINGVTQDMRAIWLPKLESLNGMKRSMLSHGLLSAQLMQDHHLSSEDETAILIRETAEEVDTAIRQYKTGTLGIRERELVESLEVTWHIYEDIIGRMETTLESGEFSETLNLFDTELRGTFANAIARIGNLETYVNQQISDGSAGAREIVEFSRLSLMALIGAATLLSLISLIGATRAISRPLVRISEAMRRLNEGDDSVEIDDATGRTDEIGTLTRAFSAYRDSVAQARKLANVADLEKRRLHTAISGMPIGLCMYDDQNRLIIGNEQFADIYKLPPELLIPGTAYARIIEERIKHGTFDGADPEAYIQEIDRVLEMDEPVSAIWELQDGRNISTYFQPMEGGWLSTHEDITERRRAEARLLHMARHDSLTDLPNRAAVLGCVKEALSNLPDRRHLAFVCFDLDHFNVINDTLGHSAGDQVLIEVARRLRKLVGENGMLARLGGDEFAIIQPDISGPEAAGALAKRLIDMLKEDFEIGDQSVRIGASVGVALAPADGETAETLLKNADMAIHRSKAEGRGMYHFFETEMDLHMHARRRLELDLHQALAQDQFELHYQPLMNLKSNRVSGFEALIRWNHPERGMVSPAEFIPVAEEMGLIVPLGEWILNQACQDAASWPSHLKVAVNLSPAQFHSNRLAPALSSALAKSGLSGSRLELEITEGVLLDESTETLAILHQLRALGARIAMDDFGTGYSSLGYLQSFPFDKIKIDGSFIQRMNGGESSMAIIRAVTSIGTSLGMMTTAEGVETREQLDWIRAEGCTEVQGYYFSKPRPACDIGALIPQLDSLAA